jgi:hypothetical protein
MLSTVYNQAMVGARRSIMDAVGLTPAERELANREVEQLVGEWFNPDRSRAWREAGARPVAIAAVFATVTQFLINLDGDEGVGHGRC